MSIGLMLFTILLFAYRGYRTGWQKVLARLAALATSYTGALFLTAPAIDNFYRGTNEPGIIIYVAIGVGIMFAIYIVTYLIIRKLAYLVRQDEYPMAGTLLNGLLGTAVGLVLVWASVQILAPLPGQQSRFEQIASQAVGSLIASVVDLYVDNLIDYDETTAQTSGHATTLLASNANKRLAKTLFSQPGKVIQQINQVNDSGLLQKAFNDPNLQMLMSQGDINKLQHNEMIQSLANNEAMLSLMEDSALITKDSDRQTILHMLSTTMSEVWQRTSRIKDSEEFQSLANDPEFQAALQNKNPILLLSNPQLMQLTQLVISGDLTHQIAPDSSLSPATPPSSIYKWRDGQGNVHYTNEAPPEGAERLILEYDGVVKRGGATRGGNKLP